MIQGYWGLAVAVTNKGNSAFQPKVFFKIFSLPFILTSLNFDTQVEREKESKQGLKKDSKEMLWTQRKHEATGKA
jgi:hypothetical protein